MTLFVTVSAALTCCISPMEVQTSFQDHCKNSSVMFLTCYKLVITYAYLQHQP